MYLLKREKMFRHGRAITTFARLHKRDLPKAGTPRFVQMQRRWSWLMDNAVAELDRQSRLPRTG